MPDTAPVPPRPDSAASSGSHLRRSVARRALAVAGGTSLAIALALPTWFALSLSTAGPLPEDTSRLVPMLIVGTSLMGMVEVALVAIAAACGLGLLMPGRPVRDGSAELATAGEGS